MLPVAHVAEALAAATAARKCHTCGCFQDAVTTLEGSALAGELRAALAASRATFGERTQDCLGCKVCWPADAINAAGALVELPAGAGCPVEPVVQREGWPPLPGTYTVLRAAAPVAVCTLHSRELCEALAHQRPDGLAIVGPMQTENLGIERLVENVLANPSIRILVVAGADTAEALGHFPGQSLLALAEAGVDDRMRIVGAKGRRPVLANLDRERVERFRAQVTLVDHRGVNDPDALARVVTELAAAAPPPFSEGWAPRGVSTVVARPPGRLVPDPAGYVVIWPDAPRRRLVAEHYGNDGVLARVVTGETAPDVLSTLLAEGACSRLDHAGYLGRELARAEAALRGGPAYVQDRAPGRSDVADAPACGSGCGCGPVEPVAASEPAPVVTLAAPSPTPPACEPGCGCDSDPIPSTPGAPMKPRVLLLTAVAVAVGGILAAKAGVFTPRASTPTASVQATSATRTVLLFADPREADESCGCGQIIRAARDAAGKPGVAVKEYDARSSADEQARWHVAALPAVLVLDGDGKETARFEGEAEDTVTRLEATLAGLGT